MRLKISIVCPEVIPGLKFVKTSENMDKNIGGWNLWIIFDFFFSVLQQAFPRCFHFCIQVEKVDFLVIKLLGLEFNCQISEI